MKIMLKTNRLILRPFKSSDLADMSEYSVDSENTRFLTSPNKNEAEVRSYLDWIIDEWDKGNKQKYFCYAILLTNKVIGEVALGLELQNKEASIGWIIQKKLSR